MTLREAIACLGQHNAAKVAGVPSRTTIQAWHDNDKAPVWRQKEVGRIMRAAAKKQAQQAQEAA